MAIEKAETKHIQLTINRLTKEEYAELRELSGAALSTELSDQLFMTTGDDGGGSADIVYLSPEQYAELSVAGALDEGVYYATSAVAGGAAVDHVLISKEDYDRLTPEQKLEDKIYMISDDAGSGVGLSGVVKSVNGISPDRAGNVNIGFDENELYKFKRVNSFSDLSDIDIRSGFCYYTIGDAVEGKPLAYIDKICVAVDVWSFTTPTAHSLTLQPGTYGVIAVGGAGGCFLENLNAVVGNAQVGSGGSGGFVNVAFTIDKQMNFRIQVGAGGSWNSVEYAGVQAGSAGTGGDSYLSSDSMYFYASGGGGAGKAYGNWKTYGGPGRDNNVAGLSVVQDIRGNNGSVNNGYTYPATNPANPAYAYGYCKDGNAYPGYVKIWKTA